MLAFDDPPPLPPKATVALIGLMLTLWLFLRVRILRRQFAQGARDEDRLRAPRWLRRLARWPLIYRLLGVLAAAWLALLIW